MWVKHITPSPDRVDVLKYILAFLFIWCIMIYFSEPIQCSSPNWNMHQRAAFINETQKSQWLDLVNDLRFLMDLELRRRSQIGSTSTTVTLGDLGVDWRSLGETRFSNITGLSSLVALRGDMFHNRGNTSVSQLIAQIVSDPTLS